MIVPIMVMMKKMMTALRPTIITMKIQSINMFTLNKEILII